MKRIIILSFLLSMVAMVAKAQVKIGDNPQTIDPASLLELESSSRVLVISKVSTGQMETIVPQRGGMVYNTDTECIHYFDGTQWINLCDAVSFSITNDPIENLRSTIAITQSPDSYNLEVATNSIRTEQIADGGINGVDIQDNSIGRNKLGDAAVGPDELGDESVDSNAIIDGTILPRDIASSVPSHVLATDENGVVLWQDQNDLYELSFDKDTNILSIVPSTGTGANNTDLAALVGSDDQEIEVFSYDTVNNIITLTLEDGGTETVNISNLNDIGSDNQNLIGASIDAANILQIDIEDGNSTTVDLSGLVDIADGTETILNEGANIIITGDGSAGNPYVINAADGVVADGTETILNEGTNITITGEGSAGNPYVINAADGIVADGTETILNEGANITITGDGSAGNPYVINAVGGVVADGTETILNEGTNITITGDGSTGNPYVINASGTIGTNWADIAGKPIGFIDDIDNDTQYTPGNGVIISPANEISVDGSETIVNGSATVTVTGTGTAGDPYVLTSADTSDGAETIVNGSATVNVTGTGTAGDPYVLTATAGDGSETIVNGSATVTVTGTGTAGDPYVLTSADTSDGSETVVNGSATVTVTGTGTAGDPYVLTSADTSDGAETIVNGSATVNVTGTGTAGDPYVLTATAGDGSETIVNGSATVTVTGTGTAGDPYVLTSADTSDGAETIVNGSATVNVSGTGTAGDPYVLTATAGDGSETIVNGSARVTVSGTGTIGNPYIVTIPDGAITGGLGGAILDNSITASDLSPDSVDASEIRIDAVGQSEIQTDGVSTVEIENATIINEDISPVAAIDGSKINPIFTAQINATAGITSGADIFLNGNALVPDYVFQKYFLGSSTLNEEYGFKSLKEIEQFIRAKHHLPGVTSAATAKKEGAWNLSKSNLQNLEKIEELFLHTIEQEKKIESLQEENLELSQELEALKTQVEAIKKMLAKDNE